MPAQKILRQPQDDPNLNVILNPPEALRRRVKNLLSGIIVPVQSVIIDPEDKI
jgi:hypothetical protein